MAGYIGKSQSQVILDIIDGSVGTADIADSAVTAAKLSATYLTDVSGDTTPQLGGTLDANGNTIDMGTNTITDTKVGQWDTAYGWGDHSTEGYLTSFTETNDLSSAVTWANVPDANITQSSVTQHQAALSITESQISDFGTYETADATILKDADIGVTVQGYDADTVKKDVANTFTAAQRGSTLTDTTNSGNITLNFSTYQNFVLTLTGNITLVNPSTEAVGQSGFIIFIQDGTGSRTVSLGTDYETAGAAGLTLSTAASSVDIVPYVVQSAGNILLGAPQLAFS